jgi:hypothetical protein
VLRWANGQEMLVRALLENGSLGTIEKNNIEVLASEGVSGVQQFIVAVFGLWSATIYLW